MRKLGSDHRNAFEPEFCASFFESLAENDIPLRFVEMKYGRYMTSGTNLHSIKSLGVERRLTASEGDDEGMHDVVMKGEAQDFKGLLMADELEHIGVWGEAASCAEHTSC